MPNYNEVKIEDDYIGYYLNGKRHRTDGPACIRYYENGSLCSEYYYLSGKLHRTDGPAIIRYNANGSIHYKEYCLNGKKVNKGQFVKCKTITK